MYNSIDKVLRVEERDGLSQKYLLRVEHQEYCDYNSGKKWIPHIVLGYHYKKNLLKATKGVRNRINLYNANTDRIVLSGGKFSV